MEHHGNKVSQPAKATWVGGSGHPAEEWQATEHRKLQSGGGISIEVPDQNTGAWPPSSPPASSAWSANGYAVQARFNLLHKMT
jgi:hypothetical protein